MDHPLDLPLDHPLDGTLFGPGQPCFGCGPDHPIGFRLTFARDGDAITTRFVPTERYQGPPGLMHGGLVGTLADELGAWTLLGLKGKFGFTTSFEGRLARPVRIGRPVDGRGTIVKDGRRLVDVGVVLVQEGAEVYTGSLRFALVDRAGAEKLLDRPLPPDWDRFCR